MSEYIDNSRWSDNRDHNLKDMTCLEIEAEIERTFLTMAGLQVYSMYKKGEITKLEYYAMKSMIDNQSNFSRSIENN